MSRCWPTSKCAAKQNCSEHISNKPCNAVARTLPQASATWLAIDAKHVESLRLARESQTTAPCLARIRSESSSNPQKKAKNLICAIRHCSQAIDAQIPGVGHGFYI